MVKTEIQELAILGGRPLFSEKLHVGRPNIGNRARLLERVNQMLDTRWLSNDGPFVTEFEKRIADYLDVAHCIAMCNATVAMEITIRALGMTGEVIVPSFTFIATAHALKWQQLTPVFCDIEPQTHLIDPTRLEQLVTPQTSGIIGVHLWGRACDVETLSDIAERRKLKLMFDAAHAFGCTHRGRMIGNFGDAEVFSFHATKFINTLEGGLVATNNPELARKVRLMKNFGFTFWDEVSYVGTNGKMTEMSAAMGLTSLESLDDFVATNRANYERYARGLSEISGLRLLLHDNDEKYNYQYIVIEVDAARTNITRDQLIKVLWSENVIARRYFYPGCHRMEPYLTEYPAAGVGLPVTEAVSSRVMTLPTGTAITADDISRICELIKFVIAKNSEIQRALIDKDPTW